MSKKATTQGNYDALFKKYENKKKQYEHLLSEYKHLDDKYATALNDYDELLQSHPYCSNCENDLMLKLADVKIKCDRLQWYYDTLNKALDIKDELNKALRDENEELKNKIRDLQNK